jgi:hypothetical protein
MDDIGRLLIIFGVLIAIIGGVLLLVGRVPFLGRLPGDISFSQGGFTCFFPLATSIILSIVLTIVLNIIARALGK